MTNFIALDVGRVRVGVAAANSVAQIASALPALPNDDHFWGTVTNLVHGQQASVVVVGYPRGLDGQNTEQTGYVEKFAVILQAKLPEVKVELQDEALTSVKAEAELQARGKPFAKGDIDSLSAVYILEDYLANKVQ